MLPFLASVTRWLGGKDVLFECSREDIAKMIGPAPPAVARAC